MPKKLYAALDATNRTWVDKLDAKDGAHAMFTIVLKDSQLKLVDKGWWDFEYHKINAARAAQPKPQRNETAVKVEVRTSLLKNHALKWPYVCSTGEVTSITGGDGVESVPKAQLLNLK
jgi:hypothetical protein